MLYLIRILDLFSWFYFPRIVLLYTLGTLNWMFRGKFMTNVFRDMKKAH